MSAVLGIVVALVDTYVWHPAISYFTLMVLIVFDMVLDDIVKKTVHRWQELGGRLLIYTFLLSAAHLLGTNETVLSWLPHVVMGGLATFHFFTLVRNLGVARLMNEELTAILTKKLTKKLHETIDEGLEPVAADVAPPGTGAYELPAGADAGPDGP